MILSKSYKEIMKKIEVTDEMQRRILRNIQREVQEERDAAPPVPVRIKSKRMRFLSAAACFVLIAAAVWTAPSFLGPSDEGPGKPGDLPGPDALEGGYLGIVECSSAEELEKQVGFSLEGLPEVPFEPEQMSYLSYFGELAEIVYSSEAQTLTWRKSKGNEDNSGDYNAYEDVLTRTAGADGAVRITLKGNEGVYRLAVWSSGGYSYSVSLTEGISSEAWMELAGSTGVF